MAKLAINPAQETKKIVEFIKSTFKKQGFKKAIVAVSGGVDSSVVLILTAKALGGKNIYSVQLPYKKHQSIELSNLIINHLNLPQNQRLIINIGRCVDKLAIKLAARKDQVRKGNLMARTRMACLYDLAKKHHCLVIGTENKSEHLLGYFTRFGDQASDLEPIVHLYKTQVYDLAKHLKIPSQIIKAPPSANLWPDQTDESELGFSYLKADPILYLYHQKKLSSSANVKKGYSQALVKKVLNQLKANQFKHLTPYHL